MNHMSSTTYNFKILTLSQLAAKKNPRQDFAHLTLSNPVPLLEGEAGLYRTGSDGCLPETVEREQVTWSHDDHMIGV